MKKARPLLFESHPCTQPSLSFVSDRRRHPARKIHNTHHFIFFSFSDSYSVGRAPLPPQPRPPPSSSSLSLSPRSRDRTTNPYPISTQSLVVLSSRRSLAPRCKIGDRTRLPPPRGTPCRRARDRRRPVRRDSRAEGVTRPPPKIARLGRALAARACSFASMSLADIADDAAGREGRWTWLAWRGGQAKFWGRPRLTRTRSGARDGRASSRTAIALPPTHHSHTISIANLHPSHITHTRRNDRSVCIARAPNPLHT